MKTTHVLFSVAGVTIVSSSLFSCQQKQEQKYKPYNIVYIMTDDHTAQMMSCYDRRYVHTPNLDRIASDGVRFANSFVANSLSGPSRACMLTGKHSCGNKFYDNSTCVFDGTQQTFPKILRENGYQTAIIGKWHLESLPTGFDYWEIDGVRYTINPLTFGVTKTTNVICKLVPPKRDLTLLGSPSGIFQLSGAGAYSVNDPVTVKANLLSQDYEFAGWYRDSVIPSNLVSTNATYSFNMPDQDLVLYASANEKIIENYFEIRVSSGAGGTTSPAGVNSYKEGTTIRITAQPASGYSFLEWRAGGPSGIKLDYPASFQHTVTGDYYFYALFMKDEEPEPEQVLIKTNSDRGGLTEPMSQYYAKGSRVTITATPWSGYNFVEWRLGGRDGQVVSRSASYTFTANSSATYWAVFEEKPEETYPVHIKVSTDGKCQYVLSHSTASGGSQVPDTGVTSATTTKDWNLPKGAVIQVVAQDGSSKFNRWEYTVNGEYTGTTDHQVQFVVPGALNIDIKAVSKEDPEPPQQTVKVSLNLTKNNTPSIGDINIYRNGSIMGTHKLSSLPLSFPAQTFVVGDKLHINLPGVVVTRIRTAHQVSGDYRDYTDSGNTSRDITIEAGSTIISWAIEGKG